MEQQKYKSELDPDTYEELERISDENNISVNEVINAMIGTYAMFKAMWIKSDIITKSIDLMLPLMPDADREIFNIQDGVMKSIVKSE